MCKKQAQPRSWLIAILTACVLKQNFVVEAKSQLWHSSEEDTHLDGTDYLTSQDVACGANLRKERNGKDYKNDFDVDTQKPPQRACNCATKRP